MTHEPLSKEDVQEIIDSAIDYKVKEYFRMNRPGFEIASNVETQAHGLAEFQLNTDLQQGIHFYRQGNAKVTSNRSFEVYSGEDAKKKHCAIVLDAKNGKLATDGWSKLSHHNADDMAKRFEDDGVSAIIFTDISRDGMLNSLNIDATLKLCDEISIPVIASGGVTNLDDIRNLCEVSDEGILGVITGRAIYEGTLDFAEAQNLADKKI